MMKIDTRNGIQFTSGEHWGFDKSVKIHASANLFGDIEIGPNTRIDANVSITGNVKIGRNCHLADGVIIRGKYGVFIGDTCGISFYCCLLTATDDLNSGTLALHAENELKGTPKSGPIHISDYVIVCPYSSILPNVSIGAGVVVGQHSKVNHPLSSGWIYTGDPIKILRARPPLEYMA